MFSFDTLGPHYNYSENPNCSLSLPYSPLSPIYRLLPSSFFQAIFFFIFLLRLLQLRVKSMASSSNRGNSISAVHSTSVSNRRWRMCACNVRMTSYRCKNDRNRGRLFWRCPFWQSDETCNLFEWDDDMEPW